MTKTETTEIKCDGCGVDLSPKYTTMPARYILELAAINIALHDFHSPICAVAMSPPLSHSHHFCGEHCIMNWLSGRTKEIERARLKAARAMEE